MIQLADLHIHSIYSDGTLSPSDLAKVFAKAGASVVSLTDHDTVKGVASMTAECGKLGLTNIAGVEISTFDKVEIHILGYNMNLSDKKFVGYMAELRKKRHERMLQILDKLHTNGINISYEEVKKYSTDSLSRFHIAQAMAKKGYGGGNVQDCLKNYLAYGASCYVPHFVSEPEGAIDAIRSAGGIAVLAHPTR
ncbi:MAG: PHP domain-containing protein, partial [Firmicutes bacterium]|nr:PHP domain-containing protein [Bacillota bacterium]